MTKISLVRKSTVDKLWSNKFFDNKFCFPLSTVITFSSGKKLYMQQKYLSKLAFIFTFYYGQSVGPYFSFRFFIYRMIALFGSGHFTVFRANLKKGQVRNKANNVTNLKCGLYDNYEYEQK